MEDVVGESDRLAVGQACKQATHRLTRRQDTAPDAFGDGVRDGAVESLGNSRATARAKRRSRQPVPAGLSIVLNWRSKAPISEGFREIIATNGGAAYRLVALHLSDLLAQQKVSRLAVER